MLSLYRVQHYLAFDALYLYTKPKHEEVPVVIALVFFQEHWQIIFLPLLPNACGPARLAIFPIGGQPPGLVPVYNRTDPDRPVLFGRHNDITPVEISMGKRDGGIVRKPVPQGMRQIPRVCRGHKSCEPIMKSCHT